MKDAVIEIPGWILLAYLVVGQCLPAIHYDWGVQMGTQDSAQTVTAVGVAFWKGFATADLVVYVPTLGYGLWTGHVTCLAAALGMTAYWPTVCLVAALYARQAPGWTLEDRPYLFVLPMFILWASWGLFRLHKKVDNDGGSQDNNNNNNENHRTSTTTANERQEERHLLSHDAL